MKKNFLCITLLFAFYNVNNVSCEIILGNELYFKNDLFCKVNCYLKRLVAGSKYDDLFSNMREAEKLSSGTWYENSVGSALFRQVLTMKIWKRRWMIRLNRVEWIKRNISRWK